MVYFYSLMSLVAEITDIINQQLVMNNLPSECLGKLFITN